MNLDIPIVLIGSIVAFIIAAGQLMLPLRLRNIIFALLLAQIGYIHIFAYLVQTQKIYDYPHVFATPLPMYFCIGPLIYFFILNLTGEKAKLFFRDLLHFLPALIAIVIMMPFYIESAQVKKVFMNEYFHLGSHIYLRILIVTSMCFVIGYVSLCFYKIKRHVRKENPVQQKILILLILLFLFLFMGTIGIVFMATTSFTFMKYSSILVNGIVFAIYFMDKRYPFLIQFGTLTAGKKSNKKSYKKSKLDQVDIESLEKQIIYLMEEEKLYCDEDLSLHRLSEALEISPHQLSEFLNRHYEMNFNTFVNSYRVEDAKILLLKDIKRDALSIAYSVGFNSYSAFHSVFKKTVKLSPNAYRQQNSSKKK